MGYNISGTAAVDHLSPQDRTLLVARSYVQPLRKPGAASEFVLAVQKAEPIRPTYHWQWLRGWNTVPPGTHTRLPLQSLDIPDPSLNVDPFKDAKWHWHKQAIIPEPFQLQLRFPPPCKYFFRANIFPSSTLLEVQEQARTLCQYRLPSNCLLLQALSEMGQERTQSPETSYSTDLSQTAEVFDLFNRKMKLVVNITDVECAAAVQKATANAGAKKGTVNEVHLPSDDTTIAASRAAAQLSAEVDAAGGIDTNADE